MIHDQSRLRYLLTQYAENRSSREEVDELFALIKESKTNRQFHEELIKIWNDTHLPEHVLRMDNDKIFEKITAKISQGDSGSRRLSWMNIAAGLLAIALVITLYFSLRPPQHTQVAQKQPGPAGNTTLQHKLITLPDGSTVVLNNNSTLDFPAAFTGSTREVVLKGEAYFDISKDAAKPFIIHTGKVKTKVLGTAFNIRAYPHEVDVTVTVTKGKVKVEMENKTLGIITPNQQISFNKKNSAAVQQAVLADSIIAWKQHDLVFDNITFEEAASVINERYNVDIRFSNENIKKCRFNASFLSNNHVDQVLTVLCDLNKATYEKDGQSIMISGEGCN